MADFHLFNAISRVPITTILSTSLILLSTGALIAAISYILYNLYIHPLARYPGPLLGCISPLYDLYHAYIGDKHLLLYHLHNQYGTIVRFTPNTLSVNDPAALKAIYGHGANTQKSEFYKCFRAAPNAISTLLATEKHHSARKRRVMGQAFSDNALRGLEQYVISHVDDLMTRVDQEVSDSSKSGKWSPAVDFQKWCNYLVFDIMGDLVFGQSFGTLGSNPENREAIRLLGRAARRNYTVAALPAIVYSGVEKYLPLFRGLWIDRGKYLGFGKKCVMEKMARDKEGGGETRKDIFSILLHAKDPETGEGLSWPELWMEGNTLIVAGSDTSST